MWTILIANLHDKKKEKKGRIRVPVRQLTRYWLVRKLRNESSEAHGQSTIVHR